jgi:CRP-like cAMP-binding protein
LKNILHEILENPQFEEGVAWKRHNFKANEQVVKQGELGETLFVIEEGVLRVTGNVELDDKKNMQTGICDLEKGSIFGETSLHESSPRIATVIAVTDSCVFEVDGLKLSVFLDAHPVLGYLFYKNLFDISVTRLNKANQRVEHLMAWGLKVHDIDKYL